ncbi:hypothetical protein LI224_18175, partial [Erysipelatoclostridium ramosum]|nr:hypothetical protein [Thomasclavelia ramosa]
ILLDERMYQADEPRQEDHRRYTDRYEQDRASIFLISYRGKDSKQLLHIERQRYRHHQPDHRRKEEYPFLTYTSRTDLYIAQ